MHSKDDGQPQDMAADKPDTQDFVVPKGWFLLKAEHQHTEVRYRGDAHQPLPHAGGAWRVEFQKLPTGGYATSGRGHTFRDAWDAATRAVAAKEAAIRGVP